MVLPALLPITAVVPLLQNVTSRKGWERIDSKRKTWSRPQPREAALKKVLDASFTRAAKNSPSQYSGKGQIPKLWGSASEKLSDLWKKNIVAPTSATMGKLSSLWKRATGGSGSAYELERSKLSPTTKKFADSILSKDPGASATLSSILNQDGKLNNVLMSAGVSPTSGQSYQPTVFDKNAEFAGGKRPFIPMVMYNVNQAQLKSLEKQFSINSKNGLSTALGQEQNLGAVSSESYQPGTKTLWRMAVYPSKVCSCCR